MSRIMTSVLSVCGFLMVTVPASANEATGAPDYSGITYMYYTVIALILGYGVYDTFFKKS
jgi:hypothetical protein